jgi:hypothetical protein
MVAVDIKLRDNVDMRPRVAPEDMARDLVGSADPDWIRHLVDALDREVRTEPLRRLVKLWDLSNAAAARLFGVSRQAFSKWLAGGPPAERADDVARVAAITDLLDRYVRRERIPAVVRRPAPVLAGRSIIEMLETGEYAGAASKVGFMFDLRRLQP